MADDAVNGAAVMMIDKWREGVDDQISDEVIEMFWFKDRKKKFVMNSYGPGYNWNARLTRGTVEGFARETKLQVTRVNRVSQARLTNRGYGMGEMIHWTDLQENQGQQRLKEFLEETLEGMKGDLYNQIGSGIYDDGTALSSMGFIGANGFVKTTGTYAGLDQAGSLAAWQGNVLSGGVHAQFSQDPVRSLNAIKRASIAGKDLGASYGAADVAFLPRDKYDVCFETFLRQMRFGKDKASMDAGWDDHFVYRGITWWPSDYVPSGTCFAFTSKDIDFRFPTGQFINDFRFKEGIPLATYVLLVVYGLMRCQAPRGQVKATIV